MSEYTIEEVLQEVKRGNFSHVNGGQEMGDEMLSVLEEYVGVLEIPEEDRMTVNRAKLQQIRDKMQRQHKEICRLTKELEEEKDVTNIRVSGVANRIQMQYKQINELKDALRKVSPDNEMLSKL